MVMDRRNLNCVDRCQIVRMSQIFLVHFVRCRRLSKNYTSLHCTVKVAACVPTILHLADANKSPKLKGFCRFIVDKTIFHFPTISVTPQRQPNSLRCLRLLDQNEVNEKDRLMRCIPLIFFYRPLV